jgi:HEAT repeat protein
MSSDEAIGELRNPEANARRNAADALRGADGVAPGAVAPLLAALQVEQDPSARGAELIALGKSGSPQAKPFIDQAVQTAADPNMRRWAGRALKYWMLETGQIPASYAFPDGWPYGTPGYPAQLAK